jgi:hypothetical protein
MLVNFDLHVDDDDNDAADADPAATGAAAAALPPPIAGGRPRLAAARAAAVAPYRAALGGHEYVALCHYGDVRMAALEEVRRAIPGDEASVGFGGGGGAVDPKVACLDST